MSAAAIPTWLDRALFKGGDAFTTTSNSFVQPASSASVAVLVDDTAWMVVGQSVFVEGGGEYTVASITDATHASITNTGASGNASPGATIASSAKVSPAGAKGADGADGGTLFAPTLAGSSAALIAGDLAVSSNADGTGKITKLTTAALILAAAAVGIVTVGASPGGVPKLQVTGTVPNSITGLGAGVKSEVIANLSTGRMMRAVYKPGDVYLGTCDTAGNFTFGTFTYVFTAPAHVFDVDLYGRNLTDGTTDNHPAEAGAQTQAPSDGKIFLKGSSGTRAWSSSLVASTPDLEVYGDGPEKTQFTSTGAGAALIVVPAGGTTPLRTLKLHGIAIDGGSVGCSGLITYAGGNVLDYLEVKNVKITKPGANTGLHLQGVCRALIEDFEVIDPTGTAQVVLIAEGNRDLTFRRVRGRGQGYGITSSPNPYNAGGGAYASPPPQVSRTHIEGAHLNGGCWTRPSFHTSTANFTSSTIVDAGTDFGSLPVGGANAQWFVVRILNAVRVSGTTRASTLGQYLSRFVLEDSTTDFRGRGILAGEIVESAGRRGVVSSLSNASGSAAVANGSLFVDEWFDMASFEVVDGPPINSPYTVYQTVYGMVLSIATPNTHTLTSAFQWWFSTQGDPVTPTNGSTYEMIPVGTITYAGIHIGGQRGVRETWITDSFVGESPGDAFSIFSGGTHLTNCVGKRNQDQTYTITCAANDGTTFMVNCRAIEAGKGAFYIASTNFHGIGLAADGYGWAGNAATTPTGVYAALITCDYSTVRGISVLAKGRACEASAVQVGHGTDTRIEVDSVVGLPIGGKPVWSFYNPGSGEVMDRVRVKYAGLISCAPPAGSSAGTPIVDVELQQSPNGYQASALGGDAKDKTTGVQYAKTQDDGKKTGWQVKKVEDETAYSPRTVFPSRCKAWHLVDGNTTSPGGVVTVADGGTENKPLVAGSGAAPDATKSPTVAAQAAFRNKQCLVGATGKVVGTLAWGTPVAQAATIVWCGSMPTIGGLAQLFADLDGANGLSARENNGGLDVYGGTIVATGLSALFTANKPFVLVVEFDHANAKVTVWLNDAVNGVVLGDPGLQGMTGIQVLALLNGGAVSREMVGGFFAEDFVITGKFTATELKNAMVGVGNRFGIEINTE